MDVAALADTLDRTGLVFRIGFTGGGEPFLIPNIVEACIELSKKHYLSFNTNLTSPRVKRIAKHIAPERVIMHASLHIKELERTRLTKRFIENYHICRDHGFSIYAQEVAHPSLLPELESHRRFFREHGIDLTFGAFHGEYRGKMYPQAYTDSEVRAFDLPEWARTQFRQKGMLCNAGFNAFTADADGSIHPCFDIAEDLGHMYVGLKVLQQGPQPCPVYECTCPLNRYDEGLFELALQDSDVIGLEEVSSSTSTSLI